MCAPALLAFAPAAEPEELVVDVNAKGSEQTRRRLIPCAAGAGGLCGTRKHEQHDDDGPIGSLADVGGQPCGWIAAVPVCVAFAGCLRRLLQPQYVNAVKDLLGTAAAR